MQGHRLRAFAFDCLREERKAKTAIDKDSLRAIAEALVRRANEMDGLVPRASVRSGPCAPADTREAERARRPAASKAARR
jgi:hypothetical protein